MTNNLCVNDEIELGNAIWSSQPGDNIILESGVYGNIPVKEGVNYEFKDDSSVSEIIGLGFGIGDGQWSAGSVQIGNANILNPKIDKSNIKLYYIFQKKLPFNSRFEQPISFVHANGVIINVMGNDKEGFTFGGNNINAESQLPKAIVNIIVPVLEGYDIKLADESNFISPFPDENFIKNEYEKKIEAQIAERAKRDAIEKREYNFSIGIQLNELEYKALWALNNFILEYSRITNNTKIKGFSVSEFNDDLFFAITDKLDDSILFQSRSYIESYTNEVLNQEELMKFSASFLTSQSYTISDYTDYHLNHLNYSLAVLGMYQEFETLWEIYSPEKKNKWGFIERFASNVFVKSNLAEMINARNNIVHQRKLMTKEILPLNKLKTEWGAVKLNEFEIFSKKKPWQWKNAFLEFKQHTTSVLQNCGVSV